MGGSPDVHEGDTRLHQYAHSLSILEQHTITAATWQHATEMRQIFANDPEAQKLNERYESLLQSRAARVFSLIERSRSNPDNVGLWVSALSYLRMFETDFPGDPRVQEMKDLMKEADVSAERKESVAA